MLELIAKIFVCIPFAVVGIFVFFMAGINLYKAIALNSVYDFVAFVIEFNVILFIAGIIILVF